ncbi:hypothetical protein KY290_015408 [Solanum tuberosum]|uniref:Uncharacterized protein n=1 Tax=Solanum tuberosum TaxID=4113 RepID=A0ABQ7VSG1_SOLTU|nr:hypothetical protein KY289_015009 [Solanum tuberosum]KAH0700543.1 hypothetical protein KY284_014758 [Solanum tuberosum]KAH0718753.1 hypothetical protein KY285_014784 [Solanum tuberosum]KAH0771427.1 hypothetical protein KY290_015408 [Solanum tuberosum]
MFPFGNSSNGNPILHSSFLSNQILLHQHDLPTHHHYLGAPNGHLIDSYATNNLVINKSKKPVKKDRHSKILTSQGNRDRRVRLSLGVARKFFDLQDMLGYDKPSKTLDWLFTKSKLAIEDLINDVSKKSILDTPSSINNNNNSECDEDMIVPLAAVDELTKKAKQERDSRAKARARARERTIKKIWTQIAPNREATASHYNNWNHDNVNPTIMDASTICCTSSLQVQKAWDSYHGSQI